MGQLLCSTLDANVQIHLLLEVSNLAQKSMVGCLEVCVGVVLDPFWQISRCIVHSNWDPTPLNFVHHLMKEIKVNRRQGKRKSKYVENGVDLHDQLRFPYFSLAGKMLKLWTWPHVTAPLVFCSLPFNSLVLCCKLWLVMIVSRCNLLQNVFNSSFWLFIWPFWWSLVVCL